MSYDTFVSQEHIRCPKCGYIHSALDDNLEHDATAWKITVQCNDCDHTYEVAIVTTTTFISPAMQKAGGK